MADPPAHTPDDDGTGSHASLGGDLDIDRDLDQSAPVDVSDNDRFVIGGRELSLAEFIQSTMEAIAEREPVDHEPQPPPQEWDIMWAARRPLRHSRDVDPS